MNYSAAQTMQIAKSFGASEVCITAHHEGGFTLWPSNFSDYGVAASAWKGGKGDILKEFAAAAREHGIKICYYIGPNANGYMISQNKTSEAFVAAQLGEFTELLTNPEYGPVHRFWIDHPWQPCHNYSDSSLEGGRNPRYTACPPIDKSGRPTFPAAQLQFDELVAKLSPSTIMGGSEYWNGPTKAVYPSFYCESACNLNVRSEHCSQHVLFVVSLLATLLRDTVRRWGPDCNRSVPSIAASGCTHDGRHDAYGPSSRKTAPCSKRRTLSAASSV